MAVPVQTPYQEYTANGVTTSFALGFYCESKDHLIVTMNGVEPLLTDWSLVDGAVVFAVAPTNGSVVVIQRNTPFSRPVDYQTYNNSFRAPAVNNDFDRIWLKLQELGVTDWILGNRIDALKAYVDDKDDELRAFLLAEIQAQGVSLDQLDQYYNYLMQRLAEIAVNRGWEASFVVDASGKTQQQINNGLDSVAEMLAIANPQTGNSVTTKSYIAGLNKGGAKYTYDATRAAENNGVTCINGWVKNNTSRLLASQAGCREGDFDNTDQLNALILAASNEGIKEVILDGFYKIGKLELGTTTTHFGDEQMWWLLKARSNVTIRGRSWSDGLFIAGGLVASNAALANTKGYCVFGDYNQANVENFKIKNFLIDNNGQNNLLQPVNAFGSQSLCPNVWFQRGTNIRVENVHFKDNPGHQTIVLDSGVKGAYVVNNKFTDNGMGLVNNNEIIDHSTIYCRATDFVISGNSGIFTTLEPRISTFLEIHGVDGRVFANNSVGYPFPHLRASYFGQDSSNVQIFNNTSSGVNVGCLYDGSDGSRLVAEFYNNTYKFRSKKPFDNHPQFALGHVVGQFANITPASTNDIILKAHGNVFEQPVLAVDWNAFNLSDNVCFFGGKGTDVELKGNTFINFKNGYRINYSNPKTRYLFENTRIKCGNTSDPYNTSLYTQNVDAAWSALQTKEIIINDILEDCVYNSWMYMDDAVTAAKIKVTGQSDNWILPYQGASPESSGYALFDYSVGTIDTSKILFAQGSKVLGKIRYIDGSYFWKEINTTARWNFYRKYAAVAAPVSPRFFGDQHGDIVETTVPSSGQPLGYACTVAGVDSNTVGTWKGYGIVSA